MASNEGIFPTRALTPIADTEDTDLRGTGIMGENVTGETNSSKEQINDVTANDNAVINDSSIDPVYEAKAQVLNKAVNFAPQFDYLSVANSNRSKKLAWDGTNGSSSSL